MLKNRTEVDEIKLGGVITAGDESEVQIGKFVRLQNWIPADVYSIKKKRGVEALESDPLSPDPLTANCGVCPIETVPDQQDLDWEQCYEYDTAFPGISSNNRGQFHVVPSPAPGMNALAFVGTADGFDIPYPPSTSEAQVISITDGGTFALETPIDLPSGDEMDLIRTAGRMGISGHTDVLCYLINTSGYTPFGQATIAANAFFNWEAQTAYIMKNTNPGFEKKWCKRGNDFYRIGGSGTNQDALGYWDMGASQYSDAAATITGTGLVIRDVFRTANKLWMIATDGNLYELNTTTLATINTYATGIANPTGIFGLHAVSDTLFYICHENPSGAGPVNIYMFELPGETLETLNSSDINHLGCQINISSGTPWEHLFDFKSGYFYFHTAGTTGSSTAGRLGPVFCPGTDDIIIGGDGES